MISEIIATFKDSYGYGWSERHWLDWGTSQTVLNDRLATYYAMRVKILSNDCELNRVRVSSGQYKNPYIFELNPNPGSPNGQVPGPAVADFARLIVRWQGQGGYGRTFLGGIPQKYIVGDSFIPDAAYLAAMQNFILSFFGQGWVVNSTIATGKPQKYAASNLTKLTPRGYTFDVQTGLFTVNDILRMHGATVPGYNGQKTVVNISFSTPNDTVTVGGGSPAVDEPTGTATFVTKEIESWVYINQGNYEQVTRRSAGRPFGQRAGRRASTVPLRQ